MRGFLGVALIGAMACASLSCFAQPQAAPDTHPGAIIEGQNTTPVTPPGGMDQQGVATPTAVSPAPSGPLPPGPPAGEERAQYLSSGELIAGGVAVTATVVCVIACFSKSSSTTTSTTVFHHP